MLAKLSRGLGAVAIVGVSTFGMIYTSGPAQADVVGAATLITKIAAGGGVGIALAAPEVSAAAGAVCATGVGCAVIAGTVAVGIGLYLTQDTWLEWFRGDTLGAAGLPVSQVGCGTWYCADFLIEPDPTVLQQGFTIRTHEQTPVKDGYYLAGFNFNLTCRLPDGSEVTRVSHGSSGQLLGSYSAVHTVDVVFPGCTYGSGNAAAYLVGATADPTTNAGDVRHPNMTWGEGAAAIPDEDLYTQARVSCVRSDGTMYEVVGAEQLGNGDVLMPSCNIPSEAPGSRGRCVTLLAGTLGALTEQSSNCAAVGEAEATVVAKYPNCVGGGVACTYVIRVNGQPCTIGGTGCADWPARAETNPENYECRYGQYLVPLGACDFLERAYEPINGTQPLPATQTNTDGDPRTSTAPAPVIDPPTSPRVSPPAAPAAETEVPGAGSTVTPTVGQDCWPSGYGAFNPASWVLQPIKCALTWAFVPSSTYMSSWGNGMRANWGSSSAGRWIAAVGGVAPVIASGGCQGPPVPTGFLADVPGLGPVMPPVIYPFDACSGVMATAASTSYLILTAGISFYGGMKVVRQLGYAFGFQIHAGSERSTFT